MDADHRSLPAVLLIPVVVALVLTLFAWPQARLEPRDVPIGVAGPPEAIAPIEARIAEAGDAFEVHRYADEAAARVAIEDRDVYGAIVASPVGVTLLTASAGSASVAGLLQEQFAVPAQAAEGGDAPVPTQVVDVVSAPEDDPRGAALGASVLPLLLAGIITGVLISTVTAPGLLQAGALVGASALAGLAGIAIIQGWLGVTEGGWVANSAVLSLTVLAVASVVAGLVALLGFPGIGVAAVLMVLIGNRGPASGRRPSSCRARSATSASCFPPAPGATRFAARPSSTVRAPGSTCGCSSCGPCSGSQPWAPGCTASNESPRPTRLVDVGWMDGIGLPPDRRVQEGGVDCLRICIA